MAIYLSRQFTIKKGLERNLIPLSEGELALCTDTNNLYIGTNKGNMLVGKYGNLLETIAIEKGAESSSLAFLIDNNLMSVIENYDTLHESLDDNQKEMLNNTLESIKDYLYK